MKHRKEEEVKPWLKEALKAQLERSTDLTEDDKEFFEFKVNGFIKAWLDEK